MGPRTVANDDSQKPNSPPPRLLAPISPQDARRGAERQRATGARDSTPGPSPTPRVIATGAPPRITPTPAQQRFSDTSGRSGPWRGRAAAAPAAQAAGDADPPAGERSTRWTACATAGPAALQQHDPYLGSTIADRYKVLGKLGEGGMGVVYLAEHVFIEKQVALKVLSEDFARKADLVARFMQEAKAASKIGHENIVDITDFGETASGSVFFAMEFLDGTDLAGHITQRRARCRSSARANIMNQICRALGAAHAKGIIHRDLKPENIFLIDARGQARLRQDARLRHRQDVGARRGRLAPDAHRHDLRHARVHVARAGARRQARSSRRHLRRRLHPVRDADRRRAVPRRDLHGRAHQAHVREARAAVAAQPEREHPARGRSRSC